MFITDVYLMKLLTENVMKKFLCLEKLGFWGKYTLCLICLIGKVIILYDC